MTSTRLYIPLSAAFLGGLSVVVCIPANRKPSVAADLIQVLIIYVMSVPVRDSIQGAFVVAAIVAGLSFGGLSMVFPEITEGLGCLLGGFCLAMWLLMLKPGGLLSSIVGRGSFIAAFCVALYALSFSHRTRPYGLIGCTSFAGGTAVVLGIDCFSRAGLKEFWLYLWGEHWIPPLSLNNQVGKMLYLHDMSALNKDIFPLGTTTYPHTRGIRVELAGVVFICLLGVVSQMRLWKIVRDSRRRKAVEHEERNRDIDAAEAEAGRRVEDENMQERHAWEAQYGDRRSMEHNNGDASSEKESGSTRNYPVGMAELRESPEPIETHPNDFQPELKVPKNGNVGRYSGAPLGHVYDPNRPESSHGRGSLKEVVPSPAVNTPVITPLPFLTPSAKATDENEDSSSVSARAESTPDLRERTSVEANRRPGSRGDLDSTSYTKLPSPSEAALLEPESDDIIDDVTSSLAATVDGRPSSNLTRHDHPVELGLEGSTTSGLHNETEAVCDADRGILSPPEDHTNYSHPNLNHTTEESEIHETLPTGIPDNPPTTLLADVGNRDVLKKAEQSVAPNSNPGLEKVGDGDDRTSSIPEILPDSGLPAGDVTSGNQEKSRVPSTPEADSSDPVPTDRPSRASLKDQLPQKLSKLLLRYRTNEWAKHSSEAEKPHVDQLDPTEDGVVVSIIDPRDGFSNQHDTTESQSSHPKAHQPTSTVPGSPLADGGDITPLRSTASFSRASEALVEQGGRPSHSSSVRALQPHLNRSRSTSVTSIDGGASIASTSASARSVPPPQGASMRGPRSSSNPMPYQSLTSPSNFRPGGSRALSQPSLSTVHAGGGGNTLISQRESMVQNRFASRTSIQLAPVLELEKAGSPDEPLGVRPSMIDDTSASRLQVDSIPRRSSQQAQWRPQPQESKPSLSKRHSDLEPRQRGAMMAQWRQSLRDHSIHSQDPRWAPPAARGEEMHMDRQQRLSETRQSANPHTAMSSLVDERMRQSDMLELHRLAMRKMQAIANVQARG